MDISPRFGFTPPHFSPWKSVYTANRRSFQPVGLGVHSSRLKSVEMAKFGALESIILNLWWSEKRITARRLFHFNGLELYSLPLGGDLHFTFLLSEHDKKIFYTSAIGIGRLRTARKAWDDYRHREACSAQGLQLWAKGSDWLAHGNRYMMGIDQKPEEMRRIAALAWADLHKLSITTAQTGDGHYASYLEH